MEAIWVAAEMRAGGAFAHSLLAITEMHAFAGEQVDDPDAARRRRGHHHAV